MTRIRIRWDTGEVTGTLSDSETARKLAEALPCEGPANTWGEEAYVVVPLEVSLDSEPRQVVDPGTICYWVQGQALALAYGPTPISEGNECRLVTACNVIGEVDGDARQLDSIAEGMTLTLERIE